jgi:hypothetical protein
MRLRAGCAIAYSVVPLGGPPNYYGNPEIDVPYSTK